VANGNYVPTAAEPIVMADAVDLYGGFGGWETLREERSWESRATIIDGNWYDRPHLLLGSNATVDGFVFTHGLSNTGTGGIAITGTSTRVANCLFIDNSGKIGGAIFMLGGMPEIESCIFVQNQAEEGGAILAGTDAHPTIRDCLFDNNAADLSGGAIAHGGGDLFVYRSIFVGNMASTNGGALRLNGNLNEYIYNSVFVGNHVDSGQGGAVFAMHAPMTGSTDLSNCTFAFNESMASTGGGIFAGGPSAYYDWSNLVLRENTPNGIGTDGVASVNVRYSSLAAGMTGVTYDDTTCIDETTFYGFPQLSSDDFSSLTWDLPSWQTWMNDSPQPLDTVQLGSGFIRFAGGGGSSPWHYIAANPGTYVVSFWGDWSGAGITPTTDYDVYDFSLHNVTSAAVNTGDDTAWHGEEGEAAMSRDVLGHYRLETVDMGAYELQN